MMVSLVWLHSKELSLFKICLSSSPHPYKDDKACFL